MRPISLHVSDESYKELKSLAARRGRPVAELIREAMQDYLEREGDRSLSILEFEPHASGPQLASWTREDLLDEMRGA